MDCGSRMRNGDKKMEDEREILLLIILIQSIITFRTIMQFTILNFQRMMLVQRNMFQTFLQSEFQQQTAVIAMHSARIVDLFQIRNDKCVWMKTRSDDWWSRIVEVNFDECDWKESFRMSRASFEKLCKIVAPFMSPSDRCVRSPVNVRKRVAIAVYKLGSCCENKVVANVFGIHKTTVVKFVRMFCMGVVKHLLAEFVHLPDEEEAQTIAARIEHKTNMPQVMGFIGGTHIPILPPTDGYRDFINREMWPSYILQGLVDDQFRFRDISCKVPGSAHYAKVLKDSALFKNCNSLPKVPRQFNCKSRDNEPILTTVPLQILGDHAYPLLPWLMKGFPGNGRTPEEESFNIYLNHTRVPVEITFGRLKSRWRMLLKRMDVHYTFVPHVVATCCVLHNFVESEKDRFESAWTVDAEEYQHRYPMPRSLPSIHVDDNAVWTREALKDYLAKTCELRRSLLPCK